MTMNLRHRPWAVLLALVAVLALVAAACGDDGDDSGSASDTSELILGGPPDCPTNPFCIPSLEATYGIDLSENFVPLDAAGPLTVEALQGGEIDIAVLFSTSGIIAEEGWIVLDDDEGLINADNVTPVMSDELVTAYGDDLQSVVDDVSAAVNTEGLTELNRLFEIELIDAEDVAQRFLENNDLLEFDVEVPDGGPTITIGAQDFGESYILSQLYGQALEAAGYPVEYQDLGGFRDIVYASFESGDINFTADYAASALEFLNEQAGEATGDIDETVEMLQGYLEPLGLVAATPSPAVDSNAFVVTIETSNKYGLNSLSDLAG
jgi:osmoprotectant transport system substrate-binding protein